MESTQDRNHPGGPAVSSPAVRASTLAAAPRVTLGAPAPMFAAPTPSNPEFHFSTVAGRYILLGFLPAAGPARDEVIAALHARRGLLDDRRFSAFLVVWEPQAAALARDERGLRWFLDRDRSLARLYAALAPDGAEAPVWVVLDPSLRVLMTAPMDATAALLQRLEALPPPDSHAGTPLHAPVLIVPRVLEPAICRRLIATYDSAGGQPSGVMREVGGRTVGVLDDFKRRRDARIDDPAFRNELRLRVLHRLLPEIEKAFQTRPTRIERYIVACYDAAEGGYFRPHRDNTTRGTAHRKFAVSINLNAEDFADGDLRFPEFGGRTYRPPTGGAVVFSCSLLHEAMPVTRGRRYAFLPFLFDEAGEALRQANLPFLQPAAPPAGESVETIP